jgi:hypothetical protein
MATSYIFNFTDPWTTSFNVNAFSSNGPIFPLTTQLEATAVAANTGFVVYGKGHPNYGERIQENLIHLLETMSGSVEPTFPISGQQWFRRFDVIQTGTGWFLWNTSTLMWDSFTPTLGAPVTWTHGDIFTDGAPTPTLTRVINEAGHPLSPSSPTVGSLVEIVWQDLTSIGNPNTADAGGVMAPQLQLVMYDGDVWKAQNNVRSSQVEPTGASVGDLWFDTNTNQLKIWDGAAFIATADLYLPLAGGTMSGAILMGGNTISGLPLPTVGDEAANKDYVDAALGSSVAKLNDLLDVTFGTPDPDPSVATPFLKHDSALIATQTQADFNGTGNFGTFIGGDGVGGTAYAPADTITLSNGAIITVGTIDGNGDVTTFVVTVPGLNAADGVTLTQAATSGTGAAFTLTPGAANIVGWKASTILLADVTDVTASVTQVNYLNTTTGDVQVQLDGKISDTGDTMTGTLFMSGNLISNMQDPVSNQDATTKFYVDTEIATAIGGIGGTDTFVTGITLNTVLGDPQEGEMTLQQLNGTLPADIVVAGFAIQGHAHASEEITHEPLSSSNLSLNPVPPTDVKETFAQLEEQVRFRTQPRRFVETVTVANTGPFNTPGYEPGRHKLQVFLNGVKLIADEMAFTAALFNAPVDGSADTGLAASTLYDLNITVDGVGPTNISWTTPAFVGPDFYDFIDLQNQINVALGLAAAGATCVMQDGALEFYSDTHGSTATILVAVGTTNDVFAAITGGGGFNSFEPPVAGADYGYRETGFFGDTNLESTITTISALSIGDVIESIVLGDSGIA